MGVKSLWHLLTPVGRPVMLETIEGKAMAIDSSIWIYQFQATMRDKDGRVLVNAHVLGFLRRICKLLFYGIKPVFVFDGGAPALKRATINERKKKRSGAAAGHAQIAERLLAAHMRREALNHASSLQSSKAAKGKGKPPAGPVSIDDDIVYLEDVDNSMPKTPVVKTKPKDVPSSSKKKNRFHDHDPYRLPDVDLSEAIAKATTHSVPDPRLATEEELQAFIDEMTPEDFDVTSPAFRELPTEVQYEIIGDLRLKSRQTSYKRLQNMLENAPTPLDFSRQQIKNLKQRNTLTQQLLTTTDSIGKAHISIPVRIASERNKEYILVKNEGEGGGWILGIRDDGTQAKPIEIDQDSNGEVDVSEGDSDEGMEEVNIPEVSVPDRDLREYRQEMALSAIAARRTPKKSAKPFVTPKSNATPLFDLSDDELHPTPDVNSSEDDEELAIGIQASMDDFAKILRRSSPIHASSRLPSDSNSTSEDRFTISTPLKTALSFANAGPSRRIVTSPDSPPRSFHGSIAWAREDSSTARQSPRKLPTPSKAISQQTPVDVLEADIRLPILGSEDDSDEDMEEIVTYPPMEDATLFEKRVSPSILHDAIPTPSTPIPTSDDLSQDFSLPLVRRGMSNVLGDQHQKVSYLPESMVNLPNVRQPSPNLPPSISTSFEASENFRPVILTSPEVPNGPSNGSRPLNDRRPDTSTSPDLPEVSHLPNDYDPEALEFQISTQAGPPRLDSSIPIQSSILSAVVSDSDSISGSRPSSPLPEPFEISRPSSPLENWDAAHEMDAVAEEGEFARFVSHVKGKDIDDVRKEIDDEIKSLNHQKKLAMRDSEEITQQMIAQIMTMLRLFGIPYITAPMEAEAQCATLVSLGLVEGIITDDSDVFLFGGLRVYKNMFNQSKTVECFFLRELERELGLNRNTLIRLAYLLGSDYVEGLPGVGPVVAMEILREFPGEDGLHKFKEWWMRVQTGKDSEEDSKSPFRKRFKKKFKDLYLEQDWPNPTVRDAYLHPTVDDSDEPFKWGLPDLDALRHFFSDELGWPQKKIDELLLPIIQRMRKRQQEAALNKQGNLNEFFDITAGSGTFAPRKRQAYASKRLQQVVSEFRNKQAKLNHSPTHELDDTESLSGDAAAAEGPAKKKAKSTKGSRKKAGNGERAARPVPRPIAKRKKMQKAEGSNASGKRSTPEEVSSSNEEYKGESVGAEAPLRVQLRPRPKPAYRQTTSS